MNYEILLVFMFFVILCSTMSIITLTLTKHKQPHVKLDYELADNYIHSLKNNNQWQKKSKLAIDYSLYDLTCYRDYLAAHLVKYPNAILPKLQGTITLHDDKILHTITFYDCNNPKIERYIKQCFKLLKPVKQPKQLNILKQANQIVKRKKKLVLQPV